MRIICVFAALAAVASCAPAKGFVFPDERRERKLEPIITPPVLPVLEHLERDPSTLLPSEKGVRSGQVKPRFGFGGGFDVAPRPGGLTASISSSASGGGGSQSASQSFSFGFNHAQGFSASQSASQAASFSGFGSGFSGSQASSQAASFSGNSASAAASQAASFSGGSGGGGSGSQSTSSAFGFNTLPPLEPQGNFGEGLLDIRHRGVPNFPFPFPFPSGFNGRGKGASASAFRSKSPSHRSKDDFFAVLVSN